MDDQGQNHPTIDTRPEADETRRAALARMGRFAGYTAPAMLTLLGATKARANGVISADGDGEPSG